MLQIKLTSRCYTVAFQGIDTITIDVQVQIAPGLPAFNIVGLGDKAVNESKERIRAAFHSMNLSLPAKRVTVNLAPADFPKEGSHYDLPIALAILAGLGVVEGEQLADYFVVGELSLDGAIQAVPGVLPSSIAAYGEGKGIICPYKCGQEARWSGLNNILAPRTLLDLLQALKVGWGSVPPEFPKPEEYLSPYGDFSEIRGQAFAKRALLIAAAGGHNLLMSGPPGAGKSMLASRFCGILPPLTPEQSLEVTMIHSLAGLLPEYGLITQAPYRDPHHSATLPALVGGGAKCRPGEISLAHHGVLFLDELPEFQRGTLEALRQPLELGYATISRANGVIRYPARTQLLAAMNPCRCGYFGNVLKQCSRVPVCGEQYQQRLSGPLLDRFDLRVHVDEVKITDLMQKENSEESSESLRGKVENARAIQLSRVAKENLGNPLNANLSSDDIKKVVLLDDVCEELLTKASEKYHISARGFHRILKVARTIADLDYAKNIEKSHLAEAIHYRQGA